MKNLQKKITLKGFGLMSIKGIETWKNKFYNMDEAICGNVRFVNVILQDQCEEGHFWSSKAATKGKTVWFLRYNGVWTDPNSCTSLCSKITPGVETPRNLPKLKINKILG
jgi:hypothetical protein